MMIIHEVKTIIKIIYIYSGYPDHWRVFQWGPAANNYNIYIQQFNKLTLKYKKKKTNYYCITLVTL